MNRTLVDRLAEAVLYEGYILYPYRPSMKNRQRWTFGGLFPRSYCAAQGDSESWFMQTECLVAGNGHLTVHGSVRFLHLMARQVAECCPPHPPGYRIVESLRVGDQLYQTWQESVEREIVLGEFEVAALVDRPRRHDFAFPSCEELEWVREPTRTEAGFLIRSQQAIAGVVELSAAPAAEGLYLLTVRIENRTGWEPHFAADRDAALMHALVSTHTLLGVCGGEFVSLFDPPEAWRGHAAACRNIGAWPVLVCEPGAKDTLLSAPIILYDYPQVAPESRGDLFDATEIDEILTLRILTLTDDEKRQMAALDERTRSLLERTEALSAEQLLSLHGTVRMSPPLEKPRLDHVRVNGVDLRPGDRVRLRPRGRADIFDLALDGKIAILSTIEQDLEDRIYLAVTVEDDPGNDLDERKMIGHRFFFGIEEVEPLPNGEERRE